MNIAPLEINLPWVHAEVQAAFECYERALVDNDITTLDELFWNAPQVLRYGTAENLYGYEAVARFRASRSPIGLSRRVLKLVITTFGINFATANCEFKRGGALGRQSQTWIRTVDGWRIASAHISLLPPAQ